MPYASGVNLWRYALRQSGALVWLPGSAVAAVALVAWLVDWPMLARPDGMRGLLRALGILTGVASAALWVASLLLMLRFPAVARRFGGLERQYFAHHVTGTLAYLMMLAHPMLLVGATWLASPAAAAAQASPWGQSGALIAGWLALVCLMVMMFATFFAGLPYARWKQWHAASSLAYLAAVVHVAGLLPAAGEGRSGAIVLLIVMVAGFVAIVVRRLLDRGMLAAKRFCVEQVTCTSPTTLELTLTPAEGNGAPFIYAPGQFVFVAFDSAPGYAGCREYHPFTISSAPNGPGFQLLIKFLGDCTARMRQLVPGIPVRVQGPYGTLFRGADFTRRHVWLAGGIGVTPFLSMAEALPADAAGVDVYYLARNAADTPGLDLLRAVSTRNTRLRVFALLTDEDTPAVRSRVEAMSAPLGQCEVYVCGPPGMLQQSMAWLSAAGVPSAHIHAERFDFR